MTTWLWASLVGAVLIAAAAAALLAANGRVLGISGIAFGLMTPHKGDRAWRWAFLAGLVSAGILARVFWPKTLDFTLPAHFTKLVLGGLLVGFGTRMANGCTSGHGVCGVSRASPRSLAATACFIGAGILTVLAVKSLAGG